jgi:hypothetical protein
MAVHSRHTHVADDQVGQQLGEAHQRVLAAARRAHVIAFGAQAGRHRAQQVRFIVYDQ